MKLLKHFLKYLPQHVLIRPAYINTITLRETFKGYDVIMDKTIDNIDCCIRRINSYSTVDRNTKYVCAYIPEALTYTFLAKEDVNKFVDALALDSELHYNLLNAITNFPQGFRLKYTMKNNNLYITHVQEYNVESEHYKKVCSKEKPKPTTKRKRKTIPVNIEQYEQGLLDQNLKQTLRTGWINRKSNTAMNAKPLK